VLFDIHLFDLSSSLIAVFGLLVTCKSEVLDHLKSAVSEVSPVCKMTSRLSQSASRLYKLPTSPLTTASFRGAHPTSSTSRSLTALHNIPISHIRTAQYSKLTDKLPVDAMEAIKQTVAQNLGIGGSHQLVPEDQQFDLNDTPDLKGKVAVITGGSEGIGYGASHTLLSHGIEKLFILSLSHEVVAGSLKAISDEMGEDTAKKVTWLQCDLSDWRQTKNTADKIASETDRIDILINNAARGIMTYQLTDYNVDRHVCSSHHLQILLKRH